MVPHYPSLMRSPEPLPDPQSLLETADHFFPSGTVPPHHPTGLLSRLEFSLRWHAVPASPREDSSSFLVPKIPSQPQAHGHRSPTGGSPALCRDSCPPRGFPGQAPLCPVKFPCDGDAAIRKDTSNPASSAPTWPQTAVTASTWSLSTESHQEDQQGSKMHHLLRP